MIHMLQQAAIQNIILLSKHKWQPTVDAFLIPNLELRKYLYVFFPHEQLLMKLSIRKVNLYDLLLKIYKSYLKKRMHYHFKTTTILFREALQGTGEILVKHCPFKIYNNSCNNNKETKWSKWVEKKLAILDSSTIQVGWG